MIGTVPKLTIKKCKPSCQSIFTDAEITLAQQEVSAWNVSDPTPFNTHTIYKFCDADDMTIWSNRSRGGKKKRMKKKKRRNKNKNKKKNTKTSLQHRPHTFGTGERNPFPLSPYRDVDVNIDPHNIDLPKEREEHRSSQCRSAQRTRAFSSALPRFQREIKGSDKLETGKEKRMRMIEEKLDEKKKFVADMEEIQQDERKKRFSFAAREALTHGVAALEESLRALEGIEMVCSGIDQDPIERATKQQVVEGRSAWAGMNRRTTFGVGAQRSERLYNAVMPLSSSELADSMVVSSFRVQRPTRPSSAYSSRSPRPCLARSRVVNVVATGMGRWREQTDREQTETPSAPTVISLRRGKQERPITAYPGTRKQANKWKQENPETIQQNVPTSVRLGSCGDRCSRGGRYGGGDGGDGGATKFKPSKYRPKSAGPRRSGEKKDVEQKRNAKKRPMTAVAVRRILAQTKAKFKKSHKKLYLFDDWMQTYVVPRAQY